MRRNLRAYRNNPIDPAAAQELVSYVSGSNRGNLRIQFTGATGNRWDLLVSPVRVARRETDGKMMLVVENIRNPDGSPVPQFAGKQISVDLAAVDTMGYRAADEPEPIVAATGAFRFLSPRFLRSLTVDGNKFVSVGHYLAYLGSSPKNRDIVLAAGEGFEFPAPRMTASEFRQAEDGSPSQMAVTSVTQLMKDKFRDLTMARMLATTGNRPIEIEDEIYGVPLAPLLTELRRQVLSAGVQPTGQLPSERLAVPEVGALSPEAEGFRIESEEEYEGRLRRISALHEETKAADAPEFVRFEVKGLRTDSEFDINALVYIHTGKFEDDANLRVLRECAVNLPYMTISFSDALGAGGGGIPAVGNWLAQHPSWKKIGLAYKGDRKTGPLDVFVVQLVRELSDPKEMEYYRNKNRFRQRTATGDLLIPFSGVITGVEKTASETLLKFETDATIPRLRFTTGEAVSALKNLKAFGQDLLNKSAYGLDDIKAVASALGGQAFIVNRITRFQSHLKRLVGLPREDEPETEYEEIPQTAFSMAMMAALEKHKGTLPPGAQQDLQEENLKKKSKVDRMIREAELVRDAAASPDVDALQNAMFYSKSLRDAQGAYNSILNLIRDARRLYLDVRKMADEAVRKGKAVAPAQGVQHTMSIRVDELNRTEAEVAGIIQDIVKKVRELGDLGSDSEMRVLQGLKREAPLATEGAEYIYSGSPPRLAAQEVFRLPKDRTPVGQVIGREVGPGTNVVQLSGRRDDTGPKGAETLTVDSMLLIYQEYGVTCEPVNVTYLKLAQPVTGRSEVALIVNGVVGDYAKAARNRAIAAAMMSRKEKTEALDDLSDALDEERLSNPDVKNYVKECRDAAEEEYQQIVREGMAALPARIEEMRKFLLKTTGKGNVDEEALIKEIHKDALRRASYLMPDFSTAPVMYYILLNSEDKKAYTTEEVGVFPVSSPRDAESLAYEILQRYSEQSAIKKLAGLPKFMSDCPLDTAQCALLRPLSKMISRALFEKVVPAAKAGKTPTYKDTRGRELPVFAWDRPFYGVGAQSREAMKIARRLESTTKQSAARLGGGPVGEVRVGRIKAGRGMPPSSYGTLTGGTQTGRYGIGQAAMGVFTRERGVESVMSVRVSGSKPRLSRMLDRLIDPKVPIEQKPLESLNQKEAQMLRSRIRSKYGSESELYSIKDVNERARERKKLKDNDTYEDPMEDLKLRISNATDAVEDFLRDNDVTKDSLDTLSEDERDEYEKLTDTVELYEADLTKIEELEGLIAKLSRETAARQRTERIEAASGIGIKAVMALGRQPTVQELQAMQAAVLRGEDPMSVFKTKTPKSNPYTRRNAGGEGGDDFSDLFSEFGPEGEAAPGAAETPPRAAPPPSREGGRRLYESFFSPRSAEESIPDTSELVRLREKVGTAWRNFASALRSKGVKDGLPALLSAYNAAATELETALDRRDAAILEKEGEKGGEKLRALLRAEAQASMAAVEAVYSRPSRGEEGGQSAASRAAFAREVGLLTDYMGRPVAPPSEDEMRAKDLVDPATGEVLPIGTAKAIALRAAAVREQRSSKGPPSASARIMGPALNYAQLMEAGRLAARAEKAKAGGMTMGAISCKVMSSSQEVRRRVNRETVNRIFDDKTYFGGTQTAAGRRMASEQGKVLIWFAPDSSHAIFFVNNFGVCEFHSDDPVSLLMEVLHYTVDWFNDPRKGAERREYAVFVGRSGFPFIYMIWGEMIRISNDPRLPPGTRVLEIDGRGPTSVEELAARLEYTGAFHSSGIANVEPTKTTPRDVKALVTPYISETSALKAGFNGGLKEYLSKDADAYLGALVAAGYAASPKTAYSLLRAGPSILRTSSVRIMQLLAKEAMEGKRKAVTLFYPALYGENGALLSSGPSSEGPDANTGFALLEQIKAYASALDDGATVRIIDGSLFRKAVAQSAIISPSIRAAMGFVPAPWAALRAQFQRLGKSNVKIELLVPPFPDLMPAFEQATVHVDGMPDVELVPGERGTVYENLQVHIAPGSTLVLWQDQDRAQYDRVFGERVGARGVASAIATMMPFIKRVVVEASVHDTGAGDARPGDPDVLREEVVQDLTSRISQAGTNLEQVLAILKVDAADLPQFVKVAQGNLTPKELAEDYLRLIASKYKVETAKQFVYGSRSTSWTTPPVLMNRGRSRHR